MLTHFFSILYRHRRRLFAAVLLLLDLALIYGSYHFALYISFGCESPDIPVLCQGYFSGTILYYMAFCVFLYWILQMYRSIWRFVSYHECLTYTAAVLVCVLLYFYCSYFSGTPMPKRYFLIGGWLQLWTTLFIRLSFRVLCFFRAEYYIHFPMQKEGATNVMMIGAGAAGLLILRDILDNPKTGVTVKCIIDDDPQKKNCRVLGVPIVGGRDCIMKSVEKYQIDKIYFTIPTLCEKERRNILNICKETDAELLTLPNIYQLSDQKISLAQLREVSIADLLGREPIKVNNEEILESLRGKVILVTGGGGSIGSELCRQIAGHMPKQLIIFDVYENNAYEIEQELKRKYKNTLNLVVLIGSVRDTQRINSVFAEYKPEIVFHAAAHKHVPLMETSPCEAIKNNVLGTYKTACAAIANGTRRFVLISTDKAVNPTNIMGASKRLCEMVVQTLDRLGSSGRLAELPNLHSHLNSMQNDDIVSPLPAGQHTEFVAVRFGNVLGSNGSVIPLFKKQIAEGGPVTVTSPDIIRYFMTIPEAVSLVLQAETYAKGGEIFVFDMGEPMKIDTLARNLIRLSGLVPDVDIKIQYTGLRPGEKLYEERLMSEEGLRKTANKLISIANPIELDTTVFLAQLMKIAKAAYANANEMKQLVAKEVSTYKPEL